MTTAQYTFLPWLRRGIVGLASAERVEPTARLAVALQLQVTGEGEAHTSPSPRRQGCMAPAM